MNTKHIVLLTAAINISGNIIGHKKISLETRLLQYIDSLIFYISKSDFTHIIFCDGTNYDINKISFLQTLAFLYGKKLEIISFQQNTSMVIKKGKGFGENEIIEYALKNSEILKNNETFYKITGRYIVSNINTIILNEIGKNNIFIRNSVLDWQGCNTAFFKFKKEFFETHLDGAGFQVNDSLGKGNYLEHIYYSRLSGLRLQSFIELPEFKGISGGGILLNQPFYLIYLKRIFNFLGLYKF